MTLNGICSLLQLLIHIPRNIETTWPCSISNTILFMWLWVTCLISPKLTFLTKNTNLNGMFCVLNETMWKKHLKVLVENLHGKSYYY